MIQTNEEETSCCDRIQELRCYDILCGRSKKVLNNIGNRRFRVIIELNLRHYLAATGRAARTRIIDKVHKVLKSETGARFLKEASDGGYYIELSTKAGREKIGHAFRDMRTTSRVKTFAEQQYKRRKTPTKLVRKTKKKMGQMWSSFTAQPQTPNVIEEDSKTKRTSDEVDPLESKPFEILSLPAKRVNSIAFNGRYSFIHSDTNAQTSFLLDSDDVVLRRRTTKKTIAAHEDPFEPYPLEEVVVSPSPAPKKLDSTTCLDGIRCSFQPNATIIQSNFFFDSSEVWLKGISDEHNSCTV